VRIPLISKRRVHYSHQLDTGANASAEEAEEGVEDGAVQVNNVVNSFRLNSTSFDKKSYLSHLKSAFNGWRREIAVLIGL
jgi:hypothetical protein